MRDPEELDCDDLDPEDQAALDASLERGHAAAGRVRSADEVLAELRATLDRRIEAHERDPESASEWNEDRDRIRR